MLRKRIIFTLIYENGFFNQSRNFRLQRVGDISWLEENYKFKELSFSLDELVILNASKLDKNISEFAKTLEKIVDDVFIPISAGGGIRSIEDAKLLFNSGADKIVINSILVNDKDLVTLLIRRFGSQSVIASVDYRNDGVYINNGTEKINIELREYLEDVQSLGVGEIFLNSIDRDGTGFGYDLDTIEKVSKNITIPLIISGGAGNEKHLLVGLGGSSVDAVATANLFNFIGDGLQNARKMIILQCENIAQW